MPSVAPGAEVFRERQAGLAKEMARKAKKHSAAAKDLQKIADCMKAPSPPAIKKRKASTRGGKQGVAHREKRDLPKPEKPKANEMGVDEDGTGAASQAWQTQVSSRPKGLKQKMG